MLLYVGTSHKGVLIMANKSVSTFIKPAVSLICTAAICITGGVCATKAINKNADKNGVSLSATASDAYMTEAEAASYIGVDEGRMTIMRKNLKYFEGAYMKYSYAGDKGEDVEVVMYQKAKLDEIMSNLMKDKSNLNFKYLEEALAKVGKDDAKADKK